jgi:threonine/homoserine/homoserine lactone efflux protein
VPGPYSTLIAATALRRGFKAGLAVALMPLATETAVMAVTAVAVAGLPREALRWMGIAGGLLVLALAWRVWHARTAPPARSEPITGSLRRALTGSLLALLSPAPWAFWLLVGSPLFLAAWRDGWTAAAAFLGSFLVALVGVHVTVAALASRGRRELSGPALRRVTVAVAAGLAMAGGVLVWQAWIGNFHRMVAGPEGVRDIVDERLPR